MCADENVPEFMNGNAHQELPEDMFQLYLDLADEAVSSISDEQVDSQLKRLLGAGVPKANRSVEDLAADNTDSSPVLSELDVALPDVQAILADAKARAEEIIEAARVEAHDIVAKAREYDDAALNRAALIIAQAREQAQKVTSKAESDGHAYKPNPAPSATGSVGRAWRITFLVPKVPVELGVDTAKSPQHAQTESFDRILSSLLAVCNSSMTPMEKRQQGRWRDTFRRALNWSSHGQFALPSGSLPAHTHLNCTHRQLPEGQPELESSPLPSPLSSNRCLRFCHDADDDRCDPQRVGLLRCSRFPEVDNAPAVTSEGDLQEYPCASVTCEEVLLDI